MASTSSKELSQWLAFFAVKEEHRLAEEAARRDGDDGETYYWGKASGDD